MAENKPKIDLKARLGRKTVSSPAGSPSIPPPMGIPKPPSMTGISSPSFGGMPGTPSDPYSASAAPPPMQPQAIQIEMSPEVEAAQKRARKKTFILIGAAAVLFGAIGFGIGGQSATADSIAKGREGAGKINEEIVAANAESAKLVTALGEIKEAMAEAGSSGKFPADKLGLLGGISIPFETTNLDGKKTDILSSTTRRMLVDYIGAASRVNKLKERFNANLSRASRKFEEMAKEKASPTIQYGVIVDESRFGPLGSIVALTPFEIEKKGEANYSWESQLEAVAGKEKKKMSRFVKGSPSDSQIIPLDPDSTSAMSSDGALFRELMTEFSELNKELSGSENPGEESEGLVKLGDNLSNELKKVANGGGH